MKTPPTLPPSTQPPRQIHDDPRVTPEMVKAAKNLEAVFTQEMMKAMRNTVEESEFSLNNSATEIYRDMLDQEYAEVSANQNSLGLSRQIIDYWLRSMPSQNYNQGRNVEETKPQNSRSGPGLTSRTGGTNEGQSE